jgi:DNA (cytosine-5)-methyltransferase 1
MRYGSVCSGIEAATMAWHPLGWEPVFFSEIEKFPSAALAHHYPHVPNLGDMTKFQEWGDHAIDLLVGGTPCQSFSVAGLRAGLADPRGNLMLTYLAIAARYRPRWLVWENVPGVLSSNGGRDFGTLLRGLGELGYGFAYRVLDAQFCRAHGYEWAVPQRRRRVFVVGYLGDWRRAAAVLFDGTSLRGDPAPRRQAGQRVAPTISSRPTGGGGLGTDFDLDGGLVAGAPGLSVPEMRRAERGDLVADMRMVRARAPDGGLIANSGDVGYCLTASAQQSLDAETETETETLIATAAAPAITSNPYGDHESREGLLVAHALRGEGFDASEDGTGRGTPIVPVVAASLTRGAESAGKGGYAGRRQEDDSNLVAEPVAYNITPSNSNKDFNAREASYAQALTAQGGAPSARGGDVIAEPIVLMERGRGDGPNLETRQDGTANAILTPNGGRGGLGVGAVAYGIQAGATRENPSSGPDGVGIQSDIAYTVEARAEVQAVAFAENSRGELRLQGGDGAISPQLTTGGGKPGQGQPCVAEAWAVRRLTPRECERLQGFPDDFTAIPYRGKPAADGPRYKALGNSMAVNVMRVIGTRIAMVDALEIDERAVA